MPTDRYKQAIIDWVLANGSPMAIFGPSGRLSALEHLAVLSKTGIDYEASVIGDLGGESWCEDTLDEAREHPGVWADVFVPGTEPDKYGFRSTRYPSARWFVPGEGHTLDSILRDVMEAADIGDLIWKIRIADQEVTR